MKTRLVKGKDWHAWAWKRDRDGKLRPDIWGDRPDKSTWIPKYWGKGKWVRVKLVEVNEK